MIRISQCIPSPISIWGVVHPIAATPQRRKNVLLAPTRSALQFPAAIGLAGRARADLRPSVDIDGMADVAAIAAGGADGDIAIGAVVSAPGLALAGVERGGLGAIGGGAARGIEAGAERPAGEAGIRRGRDGGRGRRGDLRRVFGRRRAATGKGENNRANEAGARHNLHGKPPDQTNLPIAAHLSGRRRDAKGERPSFSAKGQFGFSSRRIFS